MKSIHIFFSIRLFKGKNISKDFLALPEYAVSEIIHNKIDVNKFLIKREEFTSTLKQSSSTV